MFVVMGSSIIPFKGGVGARGGAAPVGEELPGDRLTLSPRTGPPILLPGERTLRVVLLLDIAPAEFGPGEVNSRALVGTFSVVFDRASCGPGVEKSSGSDVMIRKKHLRLRYKTTHLA